MIPAVGENLKLGRGALLLAPWVSGVPDDAFDKVGNVSSLELSWEVETIQKRSSTQASSPIIAQAVTSQILSATASCDEHTKENLKRFFFATEATANQTIDTTNTQAINDVVTGKVYKLDHRNVTITTVLKGSTALVSGTDYKVYPVQGYIEFIDSATLSDGDDVNVNYSRPVVNLDHIRLGTVSEQIATLRYVSDDSNTSGVAAGDQILLHKTQITPDGSYQLISDDYGPFSLKFVVLSDAANNPNDPLGRIERLS